MPIIQRGPTYGGSCYYLANDWTFSGWHIEGISLARTNEHVLPALFDPFLQGDDSVR